MWLYQLLLWWAIWNILDIIVSMYTTKKNIRLIIYVIILLAAAAAAAANANANALTRTSVLRRSK